MLYAAVGQTWSKLVMKALDMLHTIQLLKLQYQLPSVDRQMPDIHYICSRRLRQDEVVNKAVAGLYRRTDKY